MSPSFRFPTAGQAKRAISGPGRSERWAELGDFYSKFFLPLVRRVVRRHGLPMEDAGDVVQDAFLMAIQKLDPAGNPKAWFYQVTDYLASNLRRKTLRRGRLMARWQPAQMPSGLREVMPDDVLT